MQPVNQLTCHTGFLNRDGHRGESHLDDANEYGLHKMAVVDALLQYRLILLRRITRGMNTMSLRRTNARQALQHHFGADMTCVTAPD